MKLEIGFGTTPQIVELPDKNIDGILYPNEVTVATTGAEEVNRSLSHPIGTRSLEEIVKRKGKNCHCNKRYHTPHALSRRSPTAVGTHVCGRG